MFLLTIVTVVLAVLYGLAWHNQPARDPAGEPPSPSDRKAGAHD